MKTALSKGQVVVLLLVSLLAGACSRVVNVTATDYICKKSVEVHLVGINKSEKERWETVSMTDYWKPESEWRKGAKDYTHVIQFGQEPCKRTLGNKDSDHKDIRNKWKRRKAGYLFVLADLPGIFGDRDGNADARRLRLPAVGSKRWKLGQSQINIEIGRNGITCLSKFK